MTIQFFSFLRGIRPQTLGAVAMFRGSLFARPLLYIADALSAGSGCATPSQRYPRRISAWHLPLMESNLVINRNFTAHVPGCKYLMSLFICSRPRFIEISEAIPLWFLAYRIPYCLTVVHPEQIKALCTICRRFVLYLRDILTMRPLNEA